MVVFVTRTDVHISDRTPVARTDNWTNSVLEKLSQVGSIAQEVEADVVLDNGDFFDIKSPWQNSHSLISRVTQTHKNHYPCPVYANVGNHDCIYGNYEYLSQQPLEVLFQTGVFQRCYDEHEGLFERDGVKVRVVGIPYHGDKYDMERFRISKGDEDHLVIMAHVLASPKGGTMFEGEDIVKYSDLPELSPEASVWVFGHWHKDQGIQKLDNGAKVINLGSLTRGSLALDDLERQPAAAILRFSKNGFEVERRNLEVKPYSEIFDLESRIRAETTSMAMENYVQKLTSVLQAERGKDLRGKVMSLKDIPAPIRENLMRLIEEAEAKVQ